MTANLVRADSASGAATLLLRRLASFGPLSDAETDQVRLLPGGRRLHPPRSELYPEGNACPARFVVAGWGCRQRVLADGRRQIVSFLLPGDLIGPVLRPRLRSLCGGLALTGMETVDITPLVDVADQAGPARSGIARAMHLLGRMDEFALRHQVVRLGRQTAFERTLHLLLELRDRLTRVGIGQADRFAMPLTQEILADALGLSAVHVNRVLQQARRDGLIELRGGVVILLRTELIEAITDWQPLPEPVD